MRKTLLLLLLLISACHPAAVLPGDGADVLLQEVAQDLDNQRFEAAMEKALLSLEIARASGEELGEVKALQEMETRHEVQEKEREIERGRYRVWLLALADSQSVSAEFLRVFPILDIGTEKEYARLKTNYLNCGRQIWVFTFRVHINPSHQCQRLCQFRSSPGPEKC